MREHDRIGGLRFPQHLTAAAAQDKDSMNTSDWASTYYRIRIHGHLDTAWSDWFDRLVVTQEDDGTTTLAGPLADQAALYGVISRLRDLGVTLLAIERLASNGA
jgi:hypothetical protein